jgi:TolB-like protein
MTESSKALFLSYASEDSDAALRICMALRAAGVEVWFDQSELRGGDSWDQRIRRQIRSCALFMPLISARTRVRTEGYFRLEWKLAVDRSHLMVADRAFLVPVAIDGMGAADATVPERFRDLQWMHLPEGMPTPQFIAHITQLLAAASAVSTAPQVSVGHAGAASVPLTPRRSVARYGRRKVLLGAAAVASLALGGAGWLYHRSLATAPVVSSSMSALMQHAAGPGSTGSRPNRAAEPAGASLAVLPFVDMSPEHNQDYFSDGLSEELLNQLAQIKDLRVTGRTSSFSFKGKNEDLRVIGEKLGVNHLLEGSVRKDGKRLRITAQLINAADGTHLWSQTYDRELTDVFAVQEELAKDVSGALSISLGVGEMSRGKGGTTSVDAYDKFLRARALRNRGVARADLLQSAQLFRESLALDPKFARAWSGLYDVLATTLIYVPEKTAATQEEMADASAHIVALAPDAWWTQAMRTDQLTVQHRWLEAEAAANAALAAAPASDYQANYAYSIFLWPVGRAKEAADLWVPVRQVDPLSLNVSYDLQIALCIAGRSDELQAENQRSRGLSGNHASVDAFEMDCFTSLKNAKEPAVKIAARAQLPRDNTALYGSVADKFDSPQAMRAELRRQFNDPSNQNAASMEGIAGFASQFGDKDLALAALRRSYIDLHRTNIGDIWQPWYIGLRSDPRFKDLLRDLKLVDYWRASGNWGDFCKPAGKDDFQCH